MKPRQPSTAGFSLVEVTLALGIVVFCLITVLGLLAVGINSTQVSTVQTSATNILTAVASDLQSTSNPLPKGSTQISPVYKITLPTTGASTSTTPATVYITEDGQPTTTAASASYRLSVWTTAPTTTKQETLVRLLITWPAAAAYTNALGAVESIIALNRT